MSPDQFRAAHLRGMQASPFTGTIVVMMDGQSIEVTGCVVHAGTNGSKLEEFEVDHLRTLTVHIPRHKANNAPTLPRAPQIGRDAIRYRGAGYKVADVRGQHDVSPVWVVTANNPIEAP